MDIYDHLFLIGWEMFIRTGPRSSSSGTSRSLYLSIYKCIHRCIKIILSSFQACQLSRLLLFFRAVLFPICCRFRVFLFQVCLSELSLPRFPFFRFVPFPDFRFADLLPLSLFCRRTAPHFTHPRINISYGFGFPGYHAVRRPK